MAGKYIILFSLLLCGPGRGLVQAQAQSQLQGQAPSQSPLQTQSWKVAYDSARACRARRAIQPALAYYQKAKTLIGADSGHTDPYIRIVRGIADMQYAGGKQPDAIVSYKEERALLEVVYGKQDSNYANNSFRLGTLYARNHQEDLAVPYFLETKEIRGKIFPKNSIVYLGTCLMLANVYNGKGDYGHAEKMYLEIKQNLEAIGDSTDNTYAICCNGLCIIYIGRGEYEAAERLALITLRIRGSAVGVHDVSYVPSCLTLANLYLRMGLFEKAEPLYVRAKDILEEKYTKDNADYIGSCIPLAALYYQMGRYGQAEALYLEAKQWLGRPGAMADNPILFAQTCNNLANLFIAEGEYGKAAAEETEAGKIWAGLPPEDPSHAIHANTLGAAYQGLGDYKKSEACFWEARKLWKQQLGTAHQYYTGNTKSLAQLYWRTGEYGKADSFYTESLQSNLRQVNKLFLFTSETEKQSVISNAGGAEDEYYSLLWQPGLAIRADKAYDITLADRNIILSSSRHLRDMVHRSGDSALIDLYNRWIRLKQSLADFYSGTTVGNAQELQETEEKAGQLEKELTRHSEALQPMFKQADVDWKGVREKLGPDEAAIEFVRFHYFNGGRWTDSVYYLALVLRKDRPYPVKVPLFEKASLDSLLAMGGSRDNRPAGALYTRGAGVSGGNAYSLRLYQLVWQPLEKALKGVKTIYFAPAGSLYRIAFAALPVSGEELLSDRYRLVQLSKTSDLVEGRKEGVAAGDKVYLYGGVKYGDGAAGGGSGSGPAAAGQDGESWNYLPGTVTEVDSIRKYGEERGLSVTVVSGLNANEESIKGLNGLGYPTVLHLASHGFYYPGLGDSTGRGASGAAGASGGSGTVGSSGAFVPGRVFKESTNPLMRSGIVLAGGNDTWNGRKAVGGEDGILTSYEVANLYLPSIRLVVLSACETALGDVQGSEGVYGLARAFKMAGVQSLIMSLWKVPDAATAEFMGDFYRHLFGKESVEEAFFQAQGDMKKKYRNQPDQWAAWILVR